MWDPNGTQLKHVPTAHTKSIEDVAWAPDGSTFVTVSKDHSIKMWDLYGKEVAFVPDAHTDWITLVAWAPDGCTFVTASVDKSFKMWTGS
jgi:WD40 repeat protein